MLILGSLLMSAVGAAVYFYQMNQKTIKDNQRKVKIFVANETIKRNQLIEKEHLKPHYITKQEVLNRPLNAKEILGKYAVTTIFKNEIFIKEKIADKMPEESNKKFINFKNNSYNMAYKLFENPNYTLQKGDFINIVTSHQSSVNKLPDYKAQYVARNIQVLGFIDDGEAVAKPINRKKIKKRVKKKEIEVVENVKATEIVLDLNDKVILNIAQDFQKNKNIFFMVKTKEKVTPKPKKIIKKRVVKKTTKKRTYPYTWYIPNSISRPTQATIEYADKSAEGPKVQKATLFYDYEKACQKQDKLLIGLSRNVYLKSRPSLKAKTLKRVYRNYIISYKEKVGSWYKLCDDKYAHENEVRPISKAFALEKMKKK